MAAKAWGGAFDGQTDPRVERFTESISFDARLAEVDVRGSKAHSQMLSEVGLITESEKNQIHQVLDEILATIDAGKFPFRIELEDIHMHIESALIERLGDIGRKLHTGRSRNDQVATDLKLYVRDALERLDGLLMDLQKAFISRAERDQGVILPGYTHLQRAQPVLASQYWCAWCEKFERDRTRLRDARVRLNESPLGAAALAGTSLPINRQRTAELLGFDRPAANSLDVSSDRDFVAETVFGLTLIATHLSNWAEEWILWCTTEFGFIKLPNAYTTGSSIMPQKRNPDVLELIRGKAGRVVGDLQHVLVLIKGLPLAYNRDLQEDKVALFDALDQVEASLELAAAIVEHAQLKRETIAARIEEGFLDATTLMEYLILKGIPMRTGHETVGKLVRLAESKNSTLAQLSLADFQGITPQVEGDVFEALGTANAVRRFQSEGSGGVASVEAQVANWRKRLGLGE